MPFEPQFITTPSGDELVILARADYDRLVDLAEDAKDIADVGATGCSPTVLRSENERFGVPHPVLDAIFDGATPVEAWRKHRGFTQAQLAAVTGLTQPAIARLERRIAPGKTPSLGTRETQQKLMAAFGIPHREAWALDPGRESEPDHRESFADRISDELGEMAGVFQERISDSIRSAKTKKRGQGVAETVLERTKRVNFDAQRRLSEAAGGMAPSPQKKR